MADEFCFGRVGPAGKEQSELRVALAQFLRHGQSRGEVARSVASGNYKGCVQMPHRLKCAVESQFLF
jgi:hypothetical protein